jgi:hypothetical protein
VLSNPFEAKMYIEIDSITAAAASVAAGMRLELYFSLVHVHTELFLFMSL